MTEAFRKRLARMIAMFNSPSSWRGLVVVLTGLGSALTPAHAEAIVAGGLMLAGIIGIWLEP